MKVMTHELPASHWKRVAERNGVNGSTYRNRLSRGYTPREAATVPVRAKYSSYVPQPNPNSVAGKARRAGIDYNVVQARIHQFGWSLDDALSRPVASRKRRQGGAA